MKCWTEFILFFPSTSGKGENGDFKRHYIFTILTRAGCFSFCSWDAQRHEEGWNEGHPFDIRDKRGLISVTRATGTVRAVSLGGSLFGGFGLGRVLSGVQGLQEAEQAGGFSDAAELDAEGLNLNEEVLNVDDFVSDQRLEEDAH